MSQKFNSNFLCDKFGWLWKLVEEDCVCAYHNHHQPMVKSRDNKTTNEMLTRGG